MKQLFPALLLLVSISAHAQVKIGDNPGTINANSILELESTDKGFLPPRVAINSTASIAPLTGTVPAGMMVYSSGGTVTDGYYYWNGTSWRLIATSSLNAVAKISTTTLAKTETLVLASNNITLTLPAITASDNGLAITIKNIGTYTDLITVVGSGSSTIDSKANAKLTRWFASTYIAYAGNWIKEKKEEEAENVFDISTEGSWTTIEEMMAYLDMHISGPSVVRLSGGAFEIEATQVIDFNYPVTFQGISYGKASIEAATGLSGPMFRCLSETYFKMLVFDATTLAGYSNTSGNDAIQLETGGEYFEVKDCNFKGFNKTIVLEEDVEFWLFETDINDAVVAGVEIAAGATTGVIFKTSETDFINCTKGINLASGDQAVISILNCGFYNSASQIGINYIPGVGAFTNFTSMFITNNSWNNTGSFFSGFDFTLSSGRDSKAFIQNNAGDGDKNPSCHINVLNSASTTTLTNGGAWYKANWSYSATTISTTLWTVANSFGNVNRITYQPTNHRGGYFVISGNLSVNNNNRTISLGIVRNNSSTTRFGETTIRTGNAATPTLFSTIVYIPNIAPNDYFEIFCSSTNGGDVVTFQDVQWYADTK